MGDNVPFGATLGLTFANPSQNSKIPCLRMADKYLLRPLGDPNLPILGKNKVSKLDTIAQFIRLGKSNLHRLCD